MAMIVGAMLRRRVFLKTTPAVFGGIVPLMGWPARQAIACEADGMTATADTGHAQSAGDVGDASSAGSAGRTEGKTSLKPTTIAYGPGASLQGRRPFPADNPWNRDISREPVDQHSEALLASIGLDRGLHPDFGTVWNGAPNGIPYVVISGDQPRVPVRFEYASESDLGPYPIPLEAPIEGGPNGTGDRHILIVDADNWMLYELFAAYPEDGGTRWRAGSGAIFNLHSNDLRPAGWTSADAAGLPIFPGLVRYDEVVEQGAIQHALRFTARRTRRAYVAPARHYASRITDPNVPPMGMRVRLKQSFDISSYPRPVQVILEALKTYGMFLADNGSDWYVSGAPDPRWNDAELAALRRVRGRDFEVVQMGLASSG